MSAIVHSYSQWVYIFFDVSGAYYLKVEFNGVGPYTLVYSIDESEAQHFLADESAIMLKVQEILKNKDKFSSRRVPDNFGILKLPSKDLNVK